MKVMLDSNIWRYLSDQDAGDELEKSVSENSVEVLVAPALVFEALELLDVPVRKSILRLISRPAWTRLMPESYLEAEEIKAAIRRFQPHWLVTTPEMTEVNSLKLDWTRLVGGFWSRAEADIPLPETDEVLRSKQEHNLARLESQQIRESVLSRDKTFPDVSLRDVYGVPPVSG